MQRRHSGFTLLEVMVVVVLIGIILTFVVRSVGDGGRGDRMAQEAQRLIALIEIVGEESVLQSSVLGLRFTKNSYRFMRHVDEQWHEIIDDSMLKQHRIETSMEVRLQVEGYGIELSEGETESRFEVEEELRPQIVFLPSGERTPFELMLQYKDDESGVHLIIPPLGELEQQQLAGIQ